jgi:hypothetical protein
MSFLPAESSWLAASGWCIRGLLASPSVPVRAARRCGGPAAGTNGESRGSEKRRGCTAPRVLKGSTYPMTTRSVSCEGVVLLAVTGFLLFRCLTVLYGQCLPSFPRY